MDDQFLAGQQVEVESLMAEHQAEIVRAMAERHAALGCARQRLDQVHIVMDRAQLQRARALERMRFRLSNADNRCTIVVCARTDAEITVAAGPDLSDLPTDLPNIEVGDPF